MRTHVLRASALLLGILCVTSAAAGASESYPCLAVMEAGAAAIAVLAVLAGWLPSRNGPAGPSRRALRAAVPLALFLAVVALQATVARPAVLPGEGLKTTLASLAPTETLRETLKVAAYLIVFVLATRFATERRALVFLLSPIAAGASLLAFYGLLEYFAGGGLPPIWPRHPWTDHSSRMVGTYVNANHFAGFLEMTIPLGLGLLFALRSKTSGISEFAPLRVRIGDFFARAGRDPAKLFLLFGLAFMGVALLFTQSRMGIFSSACSFAVMGILFGSREQRRRRLLVLFSLIILIFGSSVALGIDPLYRRFSLIEDEAPGRVLVWEDTWQGVKERYWLTGAGLGAYLFTFPEFQTRLIDGEYAEAHNDYLNLLWDTGVLGVVPAGIFVLMVIGAVGRPRGQLRGWQRSALAGAGAGVVALLLHSLTDFNLQVPANGLLFAVTAGIAVGASTALPHRKSAEAAAE